MMLRLFLLLIVFGACFTAADRTLAIATPSHDDAPAIIDHVPAQDDAAAQGDTRVPVQVWTVLSAAGAMAVGLLFFLVRLVLGWVKPAPPSQEEGGH
jgi:hypothetical protein